MQTPISGFSKLKKALDKIIAERRARNGVTEAMKHWTIHDIRRSAATGMGELDIPPHHIEGVLHHVSGSRARHGGCLRARTVARDCQDAAA